MRESAGEHAVCVVGAGVAGLLTARHLLDQGMRVRVVERRMGLGGLWNHDPRYGGVYRSAHLISSKLTTQLPDFPMPDEFPDFPSHAHVLDYLRGFARRHALSQHIAFGTPVARATPLDGGGWRVALADGSEQEYAAVVLATGHHWDPVRPELDAVAFDGAALHVADYDTAEIFSGRRVVVVGLGNSACDVAVDAVYAGADVTLAVRGGNHVIPKYLLGRPTDRLAKEVPLMRLTSRLPAPLRVALDERMLRVLAGRPERFGLPRPKHRLYQRQPLVNSLLLYHLGHGDIRVKPPAVGLRGSSVSFADDTEEKADVVVWCTGYRVSLPFVDVRAHLNGDRRARPRLWLNMFHPRRDDVAAVGMVDPLGSWTALDLQARLAATHLRTVTSHRYNVPPLRSLADFGTARLGDGPDRDWLFRGHAYTRTLRTYLHRLTAVVG